VWKASRVSMKDAGIYKLNGCDAPLFDTHLFDRTLHIGITVVTTVVRMVVIISRYPGSANVHSSDYPKSLVGNVILNYDAFSKCYRCY